MFSKIDLKKRRLKKGLSQMEIEETLAINKSSYSSFECEHAKN